MKNDKRDDDLTRENVLKLLSDEEIASVCTAESADRLAGGDEFLDMAHLAQGVRRAVGEHTPTGRVLPKKAVHEGTWSKILVQLAVARATAAISGP